ncbi:carboxypeptidase regulatory-like domain-containing protein [Sphingopyxis sp. Q841]|jgi:hypothetical protein|uniref:carboxypeptidase regulatory-like domain-containing protein n=1 Tax=Sphingopyxis sp. Q841 TaxID=3458250 RepID=UPI004035DC77
MKGPAAIFLLLASGVGIAAASAASPSSLQVQVTDDRGLPVRDAVVELDPEGGWRGGRIRFPGRAAMAQKDIAFTPGTLIVAKGSSVAFPNLDTVRHSIYSFSKAARFEIDLYGRDQTRSKTFPVVGTVALGCNIHDQMRGYIRVVDTPYAAKTDRNGIVRLSGLSAGDYTLTVWHPRASAPGSEIKRVLAVAAGQNSKKISMKLR